ncbi:hypothetical protein R8Z50_22770 [Longispora sp. K20-0274]|uniref:hypothetical protein n=1 Tax=Longispora sp. K20-0274 TaxID=3088255 RepID=UPI003999553A
MTTRRAGHAVVFTGRWPQAGNQLRFDVGFAGTVCATDPLIVAVERAVADAMCAVRDEQRSSHRGWLIGLGLGGQALEHELNAKYRRLRFDGAVFVAEPGGEQPAQHVKPDPDGRYRLHLGEEWTVVHPQRCDRVIGPVPDVLDRTPDIVLAGRPDLHPSIARLRRGRLRDALADAGFTEIGEPDHARVAFRDLVTVRFDHGEEVSVLATPAVAPRPGGVTVVWNVECSSRCPDEVIASAITTISRRTTTPAPTSTDSVHEQHRAHLADGWKPVIGCGQVSCLHGDLLLTVTPSGDTRVSVLHADAPHGQQAAWPVLWHVTCHRDLPDDILAAIIDAARATQRPNG